MVSIIDVRGPACLAAVLLTALPAQADQSAITVTVRHGETLIGLGRTWLARPAAWPRLQELNQVAEPRRLPTGFQLKIPTALLKAEPVKASVESVTGEVTSSLGPLLVGSRLAASDFITTSAGGYAAIRLPDGSRFVVQPESSLRIEQLQHVCGSSSQASRLSLPRGRLEQEVAPQRGPRARYEVKTPTAVIGVRGTAFRVAHNPADGRSHLEVTTGVVEGNATTRIAAGKGAVLDRRGAHLVTLLPAPDLRAVDKVFERPLLRIPLPDTPGAVAHRVIVADSRGFAQPVFDALSEGREARVPGLPDGDYVLRMRAVDQAGLEGFDADGGFRLKARPEPPFLSTPVAGARQVAGTIDFTWTEQPEAARYRFQVAGEGGFERPVVQEDELRTPAFATGLPPGQYQWRLASVRGDGDRGPWSDPQGFTLKPPQAAPEPPTVGPDEVSFAWPGQTGQQFNFQMARDMQFTNVVEQREVSEPRLTLARPAPGEYFVRVRAVDPDGYVSPWSGAQRFDVPQAKGWLLLLLLPVLAATL